MSAPFLTIYHQLMTQQTAKITGLWLIHGNEPLLHSWFIDACRILFKQNNQIVQRIELNNSKDWDNVIGALGSLSLFGDDVALILTGKSKPSKNILMALDKFADDAKTNNSNHALIYSLTHQDKKSQNNPLFTLFARKGSVIDAQIHNEDMRQSILKTKAMELSVKLDDESWRFLLNHTENNLLSAYQALMRAADLYYHQDDPLNMDAVMDVIVSDYQYSTFHLTDNILAGDAVRAMRILRHLKQTNTAPSLILWALSKEIRQILRLQDGQSVEALGIWQSKKTLYQNVSKDGRFCGKQLAHIYAIDKSIKGLSHENSWQLLEQLLLNLCGIQTLMITQANAYQAIEAPQSML